MSAQARKELDAIDLLMQDHREIESLFSEFAYLHDNGEDTAVVIENACAELKIHDALENDLFYPAVSDASDSEAIEALLDESEDAHDSVLDLMEALEVTDDEAAARVQFKALAELMKQHMLHEEAELFPKVRALKQLDLDALATRMKARITELTPQLDSLDAPEAAVASV